MFFYFGRIPFPLKQTHPLNYIIKNFCFSPNGMKRLFFGNGKQKRAIEQPFPRLINIPFSFYRFTHMQTRKPFTLSRKPLYYHENSHRISVIIQTVSVSVSAGNQDTLWCQDYRSQHSNLLTIMYDAKWKTSISLLL